MSRTVALILTCCVAAMSVPGCASRQVVENELYRVWDNGNVGYMDATGRVVISATFHQGQDFHEGQAVVVVDAREWAGQWAVIDREGGFLIEPSNDHPVWFHEGRWVMNRGGVHRYGGGAVWWGDEWFLADVSGSPLGNGAMYEMLYSLQDGRAAVQVGDQWGFLDCDGRMVIQPQFRSWTYFDSGVAVLRGDEGVGAIDRNGEWAIEPVYDRISPQFRKGRAFAVLGDRWGVIDTAGNWLATFELPLPDGLNGSVARLKPYLPSWVRGAYRYDPMPYKLVNLDGRQTDYWVADDGTFFRDGLMSVIRDGKLGYINEDLEVVIPCRFQHPDSEEIDYDDPWEYRTDFRDGVAPAMMNDCWGYIDREGKWLVEPCFKLAHHFRGELALVVDEETVGYINRQGEYVWRVSLEETQPDDPDRQYMP